MKHTVINNKHHHIRLVNKSDLPSGQLAFLDIMLAFQLHERQGNMILTTRVDPTIVNLNINQSSFSLNINRITTNPIGVTSNTIGVTPNIVKRLKGNKCIRKIPTTRHGPIVRVNQRSRLQLVDLVNLILSQVFELTRFPSASTQKELMAITFV